MKFYCDLIASLFAWFEQDQTSSEVDVAKSEEVDKLTSEVDEKCALTSDEGTIGDQEADQKHPAAADSTQQVTV